ncbi:MAG: hypothetical protein WDN06_14815 [Asticcacaulis sp.]
MSDPAPAPTAQVLFIEDSAAEIRLVTELLNRARVQFDGHWVTSGEDALRFLLTRPVSRRRPGQTSSSSTSTCRCWAAKARFSKFRPTRRSKSSPWSSCQAPTTRTTSFRRANRGAVHYLVKPLNYEKLCEAVARIRSLKLEPRGDELFLCAEA